MPTIIGTIDKGGDGKTVLIAIINKKENLALDINDFVFGDPVTPTGANPIRNTTINLYPKASSGYYGTKTIWYNRIHVSELGAIVVPKGTAVNVSDLLPTISASKGILITATDIVDGPLPPPDAHGNVSVNLTFSQSSIIYYGGTIIIAQTNSSSTAAGTLLSTYCENFSKKGIYSNGIGGSYVSVIETNSAECGYIAPATASDFTFGILMTGNLSSTPLVTDPLPPGVSENYSVQIDKNKISTKLNNLIPHTPQLSQTTAEFYQQTLDYIFSGVLVNSERNDFELTWPVGTSIRAMDRTGGVFDSLDNGNSWTPVASIFNQPTSTDPKVKSTLNICSVINTDNNFIVVMASLITTTIVTGIPPEADTVNTTTSQTFYYTTNSGLTWSQSSTQLGASTFKTLNSRNMGFTLRQTNFAYFISDTFHLAYKNLTDSSNWNFIDIETKIKNALNITSTTVFDSHSVIQYFFIEDSNLNTDINLIVLVKHQITGEVSLLSLEFNISNVSTKDFTFVNTDVLDVNLVNTDYNHQLALSEMFGITTHDTVPNKTVLENRIQCFVVPYKTAVIKNTITLRFYVKHIKLANWTYTDIEIPKEKFKAIRCNYSGVQNTMLSIDTYGLTRLHFSWSVNQARYLVSLIKEIDYNKGLPSNAVKTLFVKPLINQEANWFNFGPTFLSPTTF